MEQDEDSESSDDDPFVAEHVWEWPDNETHAYDDHDDDSVVYDFGWEEADDGWETVAMYRMRAGTYTRFVNISQPEGASDEEFCTSSMVLEIVYDEDEQIHGEMREYEYHETGDGKAGHINIEVDCFAGSYNMPMTGFGDMQMTFDYLQHLGDTMSDVGGDE